MKTTGIAIVIAGGLIAAAILMTLPGGVGGGDSDGGNNVTVAGGMQIIDLTARGGYSPRQSVAQAGVPTTLRVKTQSTYDCSSALVIPSIGYREFLPASGITEIALPAQQPGTTLQGSCAMGMYRFSISFQ